MQNKGIIIAFLLGFFTVMTGCNDTQKSQDDVTEELREKAEETVAKDKSGTSDKKKVAVITGEGFQDAEAFMPIGYLANRGIDACVIGSETGKVTSYNSDFTIKIHKAIDEVSIDDYRALIIPGGKAPESLRKDEAIVKFAKEFLESGKPVAAICHGPQILITAGVMEGKTATAYKTVESEMKEAGVDFKDEALVVDDNLITSRNPGDLDRFAEAIYKRIKENHDCKEE
ncbi:MAG: type 1 glutamine amidotransferase [Bacteroidales bacterium]|nr:type 1 glutamine amidotransferase [Bacteroidales bacterium]MCF8327061.1 type 1 glutamine amidotransferase [Bacteroidales bacterium]